MDDCYTFKHRIQNLLDTKAFSFQTPKPNIQNIPLPEHENRISAISTFDTVQIKIERVYTIDVYNSLVKAGYYPTSEVLPLSLMKEMVASMAKAGLIVYADRTGIVATISEPPKPITNEEAKEFLAIVKANEYNVVDQLRKLLAQISLLELLQMSVKHQKALMKVRDLAEEAGASENLSKLSRITVLLV
ncbi:hypothetical protein NL676_038317 [Syzygium grande]|nr:hypothetical protein NL676_038317 [Syzygium grande]